MKPRILGRLATTVVAAALTATGLVAAPPAHAAPAADAPHAPSALTTNHLTGPVDVDAATTPVLGWAVGGGVQAGYEIQVATSADALGQSGATWDSGKVTSSANASVSYTGPALDPAKDYYWRVRTWDAADAASSWSDPAQFGTGPGSTWAGATPIWTPTTSVSGGWSDYTYTGTFSILASKASVTFRATDANNLYLWQFSTTQVAPQIAKGGVYTNLKTAENYPSGFSVSSNTSYDFKISAFGSTFTTYLRRTGTTDWTLVDTTVDSTYPTGGIGVRTGRSESYTLDDLLVQGTDGSTLYANDFSDAGNTDFSCASIGSGVLTVPISVNCVEVPPGSVVVSTNWAFMRGSVSLADKPIAWAHLYATGASTSGAKQFVYKMSLNGDFVGTGPTRSVGSETRYDGFDVTDQVKQGQENVIGALAYTTSTKKFLADLVVEYADGTTQTFGTGTGWKAIDGSYAIPAAGSIGTGNYTLSAENFNAAAYPFGFDKAGFDDSEWAAAVAQPAFANLVPTPTAKVGRKLEKPASVTEYAPGDYFIDYGRTWMGGLSLDLDGTAGQQVDIRYGQVASGVNTVKYQTSAGNDYEDIWTLTDGQQHLETWGLRVFRYVQVTGAPTGLTAADLTAEAYLYPFDESQADFDSSDANLNAVWQLSKNTVETANQDLYVDSWERERGPYEADGYMQQLENLYTGGDSALGSYSFDFLQANPTWPTEWPMYDILAAQDSYMATGDVSTLAANYTALQSKLPTTWLDPATGLIHKTTGSDGASGCGMNCDIVDWPAGERDGYQFTSYNTVINAISYRSFADMAAIATALGHTADAATYTADADALKQAVNDKMWDPSTGAYRDGLNDDGTPIDHFAIQATVFAVAFGLADQDQASAAADYIGTRGMACSVYCAGFLLQAVYDAGDGQLGQSLLTGTGQHSWMHEIALGAGAAMEAWDPSEKSNLSYSHPWGASPAYNIPRDLFGIQPTTPGYATFQVKPQRGSIRRARITVPTQNGRIGVAFAADGDGTDAAVDVPANSSATAYLPADSSSQSSVYVDGVETAATYADGFMEVDGLAPGCHILTGQDGQAPYSDSRLTDVCSSGYSLPDRQAPTVTATVSPAAVGDWHGADTQVTLHAEDASGIASTEYQLDGGSWTAYTGPIALGDGTHTVGYRATDKAGNPSTPGQVDVKVDGTAPALAATVSATRLLTVSGTDGGSGVASLQYAVDDGDWGSYTTPVQLDGAVRTVRVRATDVAGNVAESSVRIAASGASSAPVYAVAPAIRGTAQAGGTLTASPGTWQEAEGATFAYQWLRNGSTIPNATGDSYRPSAADVGSWLSVRVNVTTGIGAASFTSSPVRVAKLNATVRLTLKHAKISRGTRDRATVRVAVPYTTATGKVLIKSHGRVLAKARLHVGNHGRVTLKIPALGAGRHTLKAVYRGSATIASDTSRKVHLTVRH